MTPEPNGTIGMEFASPEPVFSAPYLREPVISLVGELAPGARVLDVGCGNGYWSGLFIRRGCTVVGIDPSSSGIEIASDTYPTGRFVRMEVSRDMLACLREAPFDLVISTEVVEHVYDPPAFTVGCLEALRPGGRIVISTPFHGWLKDLALAATGKLDVHHDVLRVGGHIKFFSRATLERLLLEAGFRNPRFLGAGRLPHLWKSMVMTADRPY